MQQTNMLGYVFHVIFIANSEALDCMCGLGVGRMKRELTKCI